MRSLLALFVLALTGFAQGEAPESEIEKLWRLAREGRDVVRPQAAERFLGLGDPARELAVERTADGVPDLVPLGPALLGVLPRFGDGVLRARVNAALDDPDFPWRPAAAEALADTAQEGEVERWTALASDPIAVVRAAALLALGRLDVRDRTELLRAALSDPDARVRRRAALVLDDQGSPEGLHWLVEELRRDDRFFGAPLGAQARFEVTRLLAERLPLPTEWRPEAAPSTPANRAALGALEATLAARGAKPPASLPPVARALDRDLGEVLGLEVRSCRRGEYALRFTADDELLVGQGAPRVVALAPGTTSALLAAFEAGFEAQDAALAGAPGCDGETYHLRPGGTGRSRTRRLSKGPAAVEGLRPGALDSLAAALVAAIPEPELAAEVAAALGAVGGELEGQPRVSGAAPSWWALACSPAIVRRALIYAVVVGALLIGINHGDALLAGDLPPGRLAKMALTVLVPYCVSTLSSVGALRQRAEA